MNLLNSLSSIDWQMNVVLGGLLQISIQATILILLILMIQWMLGRYLSAAWRYRLWFLVMLRLVLPFSPESHLSIYNWLTPIQSIASNSIQLRKNTDSVISRSSTVNLQPQLLHTASSALTENMAEKASAATQSTLKNPVIPVVSEVQNHANGDSRGVTVGRWIMGLWLSGIGLLLILMTTKTLRLVRAIRHLPLTNNTEATEVLEECRQLMGVHKTMPIVETRLVHSPGLWVFGRAILLMPEWMLGRLSKQEMEHVFLHELAHLRRRDILWNWIAAILQTIHWFNPFVWLAVTRMRSDQELSCDAMVLEKLGQTKAREYGHTILKLLEGIQSPTVTPGIVGILEDPAQMKRRITRIACFRHPKKISVIVGILVMIILGATTLTNARSLQSIVNTQNQSSLFKTGNNNVLNDSQNNTSVPTSNNLAGQNQATNKIHQAIEFTGTTKIESLSSSGTNDVIIREAYTVVYNGDHWLITTRFIESEPKLSAGERGLFAPNFIQIGTDGIDIFLLCEDVNKNYVGIVEPGIVMSHVFGGVSATLLWQTYGFGNLTKAKDIEEMIPNFGIGDENLIREGKYKTPVKYLRSKKNPLFVEKLEYIYDENLNRTKDAANATSPGSHNTKYTCGIYQMTDYLTIDGQYYPKAFKYEIFIPNHKDQTTFSRTMRISGEVLNYKFGVEVSSWLPKLTGQKIRIGDKRFTNIVTDRPYVDYFVTNQWYGRNHPVVNKSVPDYLKALSERTLQ